MGSLATAPLKPLREGATVAVLDSAWFESLLADALDSEQVQAALKNALETEGAEHMVETLFESGLVDEFIDRLAADGAIWGLIDKAIRTPGAEQLVSSDALWALIDKALASDGAERVVAGLFDNGLADPIVDRLRMSKAVWRLVDQIAASQAVTSAMTQQSLGFADQFRNEMRARSQKADDWLLDSAHRHHKKKKQAPASVNGSGPQPGDLRQRPAAVMPPAGADSPVQSDVHYVGIVSRTIAFAIDAGLISLVAFVVELGAALIVSLARLPDGLKNAMIAAGAALFALWAMTYFVAFWSTTGQTPGARIMQFRVVPTKGDTLKPRRAVLRGIGLVLAAIPLFAGYLPVAFARKRRGLQDYVARTVVVDAPQLSLAEQRRVAEPPERTIELVVTASAHSGDATVVPNGEAASRPDQLAGDSANRNGESDGARQWLH